jgi:hypothetical protein
MQTVSRGFVRAACVAIAAAALACGESGTPSNPNDLTNIPTPVLTTLNVSLSASSVAPGSKVAATVTGVDQNGIPIGVSAVSWSSSAPSVATVNSAGVVTAVQAGTAQIVASAGGKTGAAALTVVNAPPSAPVASVSVSPATSSLVIGTTQQLTATTRDASGNTLTGRDVTWSSSDPATATVSPTGSVQGISAGTATIVATSETKTASAVITVAASMPQPACSPTAAVQMAVGDVRMLTASEYVMVAFNSATVPSSTTGIEIASTGTIAVPTPALSASRAIDGAAISGQLEAGFRQRERIDVAGGGLRSRARARTVSARTQLTGVPANPAVGTVVQLNANLAGNTCSDAKKLHASRVVSVLPHTIVLIDNQAPAGGYTDAELRAFGAAFDTIGFALDTTNFGANTDIDSNNRIAIFFTPGINQIPGPVGGVIGGLFAARDLFPANTSGCVASNEGEIFYMPVPDPNSTINSSYTNKVFIASLVAPTLVHEFQHLINAGRRIYVNDADDFEEVWLNEGLSHIAEELLYYRMSGNAPLQNIDAVRVESSQAQLSAFNNNQSQNISRLSTYLGAPELNSPYALVDGLPMRGAIWQMLRYAADQKGGAQQQTWRALVNTRTNGQTNFNAVFGNITTTARDWAVAQFVDDLGFAVPSRYTNPSWNYRSLFDAIGSPTLPLLTHQLVAGTNVQMSLVGGGAGYTRFGVNAGVAATTSVTSQNQAVPPAVNFLLVRTK